MHPTILNIIHSKRVRRMRILFLAILLLCSGEILPAGMAQAASPSTTKSSGIRTLVVYSNESGESKDYVRLLDLYIGQFTPYISLKSDDKVTAGDLQAATHLVYYGKVIKKLPPETVQLIVDFKGPVLAIGENIEQLLERFSFMKVGSQITINRISKGNLATDEQGFDQLDVDVPITQIELKRGIALYRGWRGNLSFPLFSLSGGDAYYASSNLFQPFELSLAESMAEFFGNAAPGGHTAYIRLEDVHPMSNPELLQACGDYLADKGIPFVIALVPVYTNAETLRQHHLSDSPQLVQVLKHLQERGASIVLHGYTHQYRVSETGEGFEFWDVVNNTPIWGPSDDESPLKKRYDFASEAEYIQFMQERVQFEESYIRTRVEKGIHELVQLGLYPIAFEAPHYTMSITGYEILSDYFNYILGQVQLGEEDWERMGTTPYPTSPAFLRGMTLLPETIGYYENDSPSSLADIQRNIERLLLVPGSTLGMFYHPYLGVEKLKSMISFVEPVPGLKWLDLKKMNAVVQSPLVTIMSDSTGDITVEGDLRQAKTITSIRQLDKLQLVLWGIAILVSVMVLTFVVYTFRLRMNMRKQLFEERSANG